MHIFPFYHDLTFLMSYACRGMIYYGRMLQQKGASNFSGALYLEGSQGAFKKKKGLTLIKNPMA